MHGDEGVIAEVDVVAVPVAIDALRAVAVRLRPAVAVARPGADKRGQEDHRRAQVVLDRVGEEDRAEKETCERKAVGDPVRAAADLRLLHELDEPMRDGDDRDGADDERRDEDAIQDHAPGEAAKTALGVRARTGVRRIVSRPAHSEPSK